MVSIDDIITYLKLGQTPIENTVDELIVGRANQKVKKIATTFNASIAVIEKAIAEGITFIITHEGIYYSHRGIPDGLQTHDVYKKKYDLLTSHDIAIFRYHDYIHRRFPDPITAGLVKQLGWDNEHVEHQPHSAIVTLTTPYSVKDAITHIKQRLQLPNVRVSGSLETTISKIGLLVGYRGGITNALPLLKQEALDLLIVGEAQEWETAEYFADCYAIGLQKTMITIGHMPSESYGMQLLAQQLQQQFPSLHVTFLDNNTCYHTM